MANYKRRFWNWTYVPTERRRGNKIWATVLILLIPGYFAVTQLIADAAQVNDISMLPTLNDGSYFLVNKYIYRIHAPQRGDIIVFFPPRFQPGPYRYVKRIIGLPNETFAIANGRVTIDGVPLKEPYAAGDAGPNYGPITVPADTYFVMGDNRMESEDSRIFGVVPRRRIDGKIKAGRWFTLN
jgi:signal peptidase I